MVICEDTICSLVIPVGGKDRENTSYDDSHTDEEKEDETEEGEK